MRGVDSVVDNPRLEDLVTVAPPVAMITGGFPSGSCETLDITDTASREVLETIGCLEVMLAVIMVAGRETWDRDGSNDWIGVGDLLLASFSYLSLDSVNEIGVRYELLSTTTITSS